MLPNFTQKILMKFIKSLISYRNYLNRLEKEAYDLDVLLREDYYNELIMCRVNSKHIRSDNGDE